jgi:hypothetical protein
MFTDEELETIKEYRSEGYSTCTIEALLREETGRSICRDALRKAVVDLGFTIGPNRAEKRRRRQMAREYWLMGASFDDISEALVMSTNTVRATLKEFGLWSPPPSYWTKERDAELAQRWLRGESLKTIKIEMGLTSRGMARSRIGRLKLGQRQRPKPQVQSCRSVKRVQPPKKRVSAIVLPESQIVEGPGVTFEELQSDHCRWIKGDPKVPGYKFCGQKQAAGSAYCDHHRMRIHNEVTFEEDNAANQDPGIQREEREAGQDLYGEGRVG